MICRAVKCECMQAVGGMLWSQAKRRGGYSRGYSVLCYLLSNAWWIACGRAVPILMFEGELYPWHAHAWYAEGRAFAVMVCDCVSE